jgi:hypothetical protein
MISPEVRYLSGYIYQNRFGKDAEKVLIKLSEFKIEEVSESNWKRASFISFKPLLGEDTSLSSFKYNIYFRQSRNKEIVIILAQNKDISLYISQSIFNNKLDFSVVGIETHKILAKITKDKSRYLITYLHARIAGMRQTVTAISLYGMDVIRSPIYEQYFENIETMACGIGREDNSFSGYSELVRVSNEGSISFPCKDEGVFERIDNILNYIYDCFKYI